MNTRLTNYINTYMETSDRLLITSLISNGYIDDVQKYLNDTYGTTLLVDGILGLHTLIAIDNSDRQKLLDFIYSLKPTIENKDPIENKKQYIMNYLAHEEGTTIHWNKGETDITTPYGIYGTSFPRSSVIKYCKTLCRKYGYNPLERDYRKLRHVNSMLTKSEKLKIRDMSWAFYKANFMDSMLLKIMLKKPFLTVFSLSVNGGSGRGNKAIQTAVGVIVDGKLGKKSYKAILSYKNKPRILNKGMIRYMKTFYDYLIRVRPKRFKRFKGGWYNRIRRLCFSSSIFKTI